MSADISTLVDRADLDELVRLVDALCTSRDWAQILLTRDLCRAATRTGRQVWPIATLCEYRLALHAPAEWASRVVDDESSRFAIGPLTEVIAQNHTWAELRATLTSGPHRDIVAHERLMRGDTMSPAESMMGILDIPLRTFPWEPEYPLPEYSDDGMLAPCPTDHWTHTWETSSAPDDLDVEIVDDDETVAALRSLVEPWTAASAGRARCIVVEGGLAALATILERSQVRTARISPQHALQWLTWCGASGGSHGRRRGSASGRFSAWWLLAALAGLTHDWDELHATDRLADELGRAAERLRWFRVDIEERHSYELSLAVVDDEEGLAFGLFAFDDPL